MIDISEAQLRSLSADRSASLPARIATHLATLLPSAGGADRLLRVVVPAIDRARAWGLAIEWDLCRFALLCAARGPAFDAEPWAREILEDASISATERVDELEHVWANLLRDR